MAQFSGFLSMPWEQSELILSFGVVRRMILLRAEPADVVRPECRLHRPTLPVGRLPRNVTRGLGRATCPLRVRRLGHRRAEHRRRATPLVQPILTIPLRTPSQNFFASQVYRAEMPVPISCRFSPNPDRAHLTVPRRQ